jgi:hypothetical protein
MVRDLEENKTEHRNNLHAKFNLILQSVSAGFKSFCFGKLLWQASATALASCCWSSSTSLALR